MVSSFSWELWQNPAAAELLKKTPQIFFHIIILLEPDIKSDDPFDVKDRLIFSYLKLVWQYTVLKGLVVLNGGEICCNCDGL